MMQLSALQHPQCTGPQASMHQAKSVKFGRRARKQVFHLPCAHCCNDCSLTRALKPVIEKHSDRVGLLKLGQISLPLKQMKEAFIAPCPISHLSMLALCCVCLAGVLVPKVFEIKTRYSSPNERVRIQLILITLYVLLLTYIHNTSGLVANATQAALSPARYRPAAGSDNVDSTHSSSWPILELLPTMSTNLQQETGHNWGW